jgi:predicted RND superfamily exporter protein
MTVKPTLGPRFESRVHRYREFLVHFPWLVFLLSLAVVAALSYGMRFLWFSTDFRVNFGPDNPQLQAFDELQNVYNKSDYTLWAVAPKSGQPDAVFGARVLEAVRTLTHEAWKLPYAIRVDSIANYQHTQADSDDLIVGPLLPDDIEVTPQIAKKVREVTLHEPLLVRRLISHTGHVTAVTVTTQFPQVSAKELPSHVAAARELRDRILAQYPELNIYMAGTNMLSNAFAEASIADTKTLIPAMYLVIIAITWMMLRSVSATISTMLVIVFSSVTAFGLAGYLNIPLTPPSMASPQIITTLAVANSVHLCMTMFAFMHEGYSKLEALTKSVAKNCAPTFLTSITTVVGFLSINFTDSPPLRDLGNITAMGVMMAWFLSLFLLPALMALLPVSLPKERLHLLDRGMTWLGESVLTYRKPILWSVTLGAIVLSGCAFLNEAND